MNLSNHYTDFSLHFRKMKAPFGSVGFVHKLKLHRLMAPIVNISIEHIISLVELKKIGEIFTFDQENANTIYSLHENKTITKTSLEKETWFPSHLYQKFCGRLISSIDSKLFSTCFLHSDSNLTFWQDFCSQKAM